MNNKSLKELKKNTSLNAIDELDKIYKKLSKKEQIFCDTFCVHCVNGCGKCCEVFVPDISELESDYLAYGLIKDNLDEEVLKQLDRLGDDIKHCPLYNFDDPDHHCSVYLYRPLICRLFNASASKDKNGNPTFRHCKWNESAKDLSTEELLKNKKDVVLMSDFGNMIEEKMYVSNVKEPLPIALRKSVNKIKYLLDLYNQGQ